MPPQRVQSLRSTAKNTRPTQGSRLAGELYVNFPDKQLGFIDASKIPQDLIAVRFFSATTNYAVGDFVIQAGRGYRAKNPVTEGAFNAADWDTMPIAGEAEPPITPGTVAQYWRGDKSWQTLDKTAVGLSQVDNTNDASKPVSGPQQTALNLKANIASPTLTGTPAAPTAAPGTSTTQLATTAFVDASFASNATLALYAPIASPALTGNPTAPTPAPGDADTTIATTAFVTNAVTGKITDAPNDANAYGRKQNAWVDVAEEAPSDSITYGRKNGAWVASVGGAAISDGAPTPPLINGQLWWESDTGNLYVYFQDGTSDQFVQVNAAQGAADAIYSTPADMWVGFKTSPNRVAVNDALNGTGTDRYTFPDTGVPAVATDVATKAYVDSVLGVFRIASSGDTGAVAQVDIALPAGFRAYELYLNDFWTVTAVTFLCARFSYDNAATFSATGYVWGNDVVSTAASGGTSMEGSATTGTVFKLHPSTTASDLNHAGSLKINIPRVAALPIQGIWWDGYYYNGGGGAYFMVRGHGRQVNVNGPPTHIRIMAGGGNVTLAGGWQLNGIR